LCGAGRFDPLIDLPRRSSLRSDGTIVNRPLIKMACRACGLVRSGTVADEASVDAEYRDDYGTSREEHVFYTSRGPASRSAAIAGWMSDHVPADVWRTTGTGLEIGAGAGLLIRELQRRHPQKAFIGVEPNARAAADGRQAGADIRPALQDVQADIAWAIAVIEHVASPTAFLNAIRRVVQDGAYLVLVQPTADVLSYDVLFVDHLHHFSGAHVRAYGAKTGFDETSSAIGHPLMPNFSIHVLRAGSPLPAWSWQGPPASSHAHTAAVRTIAAMTRLDETLARLVGAGRRVAAFGVREVYSLARAYSGIDTCPLVCGLDDDPQRLAGRGLPFPIVRPEEAHTFGVTDVVLTMNAVHYGVARRRCESLGLSCHAVLDEASAS